MLSNLSASIDRVSFQIAGACKQSFFFYTDRLAKVMERDRKYGPIYRTWIVGLPFVHVTTAELAETVLNLRNTSKGQIYTFLRSWIGLGLLTSDGETWARSRKLITPTFHFQILEGYIDVFRKNGENLINKLRKHADTGVPVDLYPFFTLASLDSICGKRRLFIQNLNY